MSTANAYHRPPGADPYADDDDLDLDLDELDPATSSAPRDTARRMPASSRISHDYGVPLRNLRSGGRRRPREEVTDAEDLEALVGDDEEARKRESGYEGVQDGLLSNGGSARRSARQSLDSSSDFRTARKGIWRYIPFRSRANPIALPSSTPTTTDNDPSDDSHDPTSTRTIHIAQKQHPTRYPPNTISNAKYTPLSFLPRTLWNEFKFFFNLYFLLVALSQTVPALRIGYLSTYVAPLAFVVCVTLGKEAVDDVWRRRRDGEANGDGVRVLKFQDLGAGVDEEGGGRKRKIISISERKRGKRRRVEEEEVGRRVAEAETEEEAVEDVDAPSASVMEVMKPSRDLKVGDVIVLGKDQRLPADVVILKSFSAEPPTRTDSAEMAEDVESDTTLVDMGESATAPDDELQREVAQAQSLTDNTTSEDPSGGGEAFIRTDQLDGETDWKLRLAAPLAQTLPTSEYGRLRITAGKPDKKVNDFVGTIELLPKQRRQHAYDPPLPKPNPTNAAAPERPTEAVTSTPLTIDNTAWANTVLASTTTVHAAVIYTGPQTRAALSTSVSRSKTGLLEHEINGLTKILCGLTAALSLVLVLLERVAEDPNTNTNTSTNTSDHQRKWYVAFMRFLILFSTIVPISLRVNLDMGKSVYAFLIHRDTGIPGTVVRTSTIPEDLGRVEYLLSDKTGTLTRNEMVVRKVHVGTVSYGGESMGEVGGLVEQEFGVGKGFGGEEREEGEGVLWTPSSPAAFGAAFSGTTRTRRENGARVRDLVLALALCHNVTPTTEDDAEGGKTTAYQASSPDEIAIVQWTEGVGLRLAHRDRKSISLQSTQDGRVAVKVEILNVFAFTSESKRMGIIVRFLRRDTGGGGKRAAAATATAAGDDEGEEGGEILFFQKGADTVMSSIVAPNDWLDEETVNMAREGLRTLVIGRKHLSHSQYAAFSSAYAAASLNLSNREASIARVVKQHLETELDLLGVTGVEDKLQEGVKGSLELLRYAGVRIWMLTGDKVETARCVGVSSKLVGRGQYIHTIAGLTRKEAALDALGALHDGHQHQHQSSSSSGGGPALLIDGQSLALYLQHHREAFIQVAVRLPAVIACRCSPSQKAEIALLIRAYTGRRIACIGDGGNDVSMIQAADIGIGIVGKEGRQASLAADFSITQFSHITKLLLWHGRNSYKRSAKLAQFVMHRGLIISVCQTVFSVASAYEPVALYRDWLLVGYATVYTMMPVFSLVLDRDVDEGLANLYPELYKELTAGKSLSYRTFFVWVAISVYQGLIIQGGCEVLVPEYLGRSKTPPLITTDSIGFKRMVAVSYTALVLNEILMVACEIVTWHLVMIFSILGTAGIYFSSLPLLGGYFDLAYLLELGFWWRAVAVLAASVVPVYAGKVIRRAVRPPSYRKVRGV